MKLSTFDYVLPEMLIAQDPLPERDESRLMVVDRNKEEFEHRRFKDLLEYLHPGDVLVLNQTKVIPARLFGKKEGSGGLIEVLLLRDNRNGLWETLVKPGRRARPGTKLVFGEGLIKGEIIKDTDQGGRLIHFNSDKPFLEALDEVGKMPLPPYIKKYPDDPQRYQTVYANQKGSVAAPTAGLHFTSSLLNKIKEKGVKVVPVLLHVGLGTFRPVSVENVEEHRMHPEYYEISKETADTINSSIVNKEGRIIAVGTTTVRCLESAAGKDGMIKPGSGDTDLFIYPGYRFKVIQGIVTNFHLPKSTLLIMICAFAGREKVLKAYQEAVDRKYRFYSFGDAMLII